MLRSIMESYFALIQKACLPGVWSKGMTLSRTLAVIQEPQKTASGSDGELNFRVLTPGLTVSPKVSLIPADEDWFCDCDEKPNPCSHVAATVIALKTGTVQAASDTPSRTPQIQYRLVTVLVHAQPALALERWIVQAGQTDERLNQTLVSYVGGISSGRIARAPVAATQQDFAIDQALGTSPSSTSPLAPPVLRKLLTLLEDSPQVKLNQTHVHCSGKPLGIRATLIDEGTGFRLQKVSEPAVSEVFANGAVRMDTVLRPASSTELSSQEKMLLGPEGFKFSAHEAPRFVSEILPSLQHKIQLDIQTRKLPERVRVEPQVQIEIDRDSDGSLSVLPRVVYCLQPGGAASGGVGGPILLAELIGDQLELAQERFIPERDQVLEKQLSRRLQSELFLQPRQRISYSGDAAIEMARKLKDWNTQGDVQAHFEVRQKLVPHMTVGTLGISLSFLAGGDSTNPEARGVDPERVFQAWRENESFVPLIGGGFAPLPLDWLNRYGEQVRALLAAKKSGSLSPALVPQMALLCQEMSESPDEPVIAHEAAITLLMQRLTKTDEIPEAPLPEDLRAELRHYQSKGVNWLGFLREAHLGAMLADDMGLGKTLQALCALRGKTLIVCPTSVLQAWKEQTLKFRPALQVSSYWGPDRRLDSNSDVILTTYGILRMDLERLLAEKWQTLIVDEAQNLKNPESQIAQAAHALARAHPLAFRIALTGTPLENRMEDLWSQFEFINPGMLGSREKFREATANTERLRGQIKPFVLRRLKREVAPELPERTEVVLRCQLSEPEQNLYDSLLASTRKEVLSALDEKTSVFAMLEILLRLRQACCHPALVPGGAATLSPAIPSSKLELLLQSLEASLALGHRALIFSQWTSFLDLVEGPLNERQVRFCRLDGSTRDRAAVVTEFQNEGGPSVMLISLKAGGVGLTLTAADHIYILDPWWNPAVEDQAADRAHRIGQKNPVFIHRLVAQETVEDRILELQTRKREMAHSVLGDGNAVASLTREDLLALLQ